MATTTLAMVLATNILGVLATPDAAKGARSAAPPELGSIAWQRDFDAAAKKARSSNKPVLVLFQEVPGCHTCVSYGQNVLSHPLVVEAAETLFVPVAVYNNVEGPDRKTLKSFEEKTWNNPVVRIVAADRTPLAPRLSENYTLSGLVETMIQALERRNHAVPEYLKLLGHEAKARRAGLERATFVMHCFWEGEAALGRLPATVQTLPGFVDKLEVVDVHFDPRVMSYEQLVREARKMDCASRVYTHGEKQQRVAAKILSDAAQPLRGDVRADKVPKYYLANSVFRHVPMTETQAVRVNAALGLKKDAERFLSPRQRLMLDVIVAAPNSGWPVTLGRPIGEVWAPVWERATSDRPSKHE